MSADRRAESWTKCFVVLVAEDHPDFREYLVASLEDFGCEVLQAANGIEALHILEVRDVNMLLSDLEMPLMDGIQLIREARRKKPAARCYCVMLSGRLDLVKEAVGADELLQKPIYYEQLNALVQRAKSRILT